jgi:hypothetical protein
VPPSETAAEAARQRPLPPVVGDGGSSWRLKALQRAQAAAAEQGRHVSEVCASDGIDLTTTSLIFTLIMQCNAPQTYAYSPLCALFAPCIAMLEWLLAILWEHDPDLCIVHGHVVDLVISHPPLP